MKKLSVIITCLLILTGCSKGFTEKELRTANEICKDDAKVMTELTKNGTPSTTIYKIICKD